MHASSFDWLGSVALDPIGYAVIGPLAVVVGVSETPAVAAALNIAFTLAVLLVPAVRGLRNEVPTPKIGVATSQPG